jgi:hypothetical protein
MATERVKCGICQSMILPATAQANGGLCAQCVKIPPSRRGIVAVVRAEPDPFGSAVAMYSSLIDTLVRDSSDRDFGAIGDPNLECVRFYTFETLSGSFNFDEAVELGSDAVDEIEYYLTEAGSGYTLLPSLLSKLRTVAPAFNAKGKTVFIGSWGMGPGEIGWMIRSLNDHAVFERYLQHAGIGVDVVDAYNDACERHLTNAEQAAPSNGG